MASLKIAYITVGEQITVEQLIENRIVMKISKAMIMNIGIMSVSSRTKRFCIYVTTQKFDLVLLIKILPGN